MTDDVPTPQQRRESQLSRKEQLLTKSLAKALGASASQAGVVDPADLLAATGEALSTQAAEPEAEPELAPEVEQVPAAAPPDHPGVPVLGEELQAGISQHLQASLNADNAEQAEQYAAAANHLANALARLRNG
jgi:hypothetical protein